MNNYKIHYDPLSQEKVISIVKNFSSDILIDKVEEDGVTITIERDGDESFALYRSLVDRINQQTDPSIP